MDLPNIFPGDGGLKEEESCCKTDGYFSPTRFIRQRAFRVTLPEAGEREAGGLTIEGMDRAVERDARRYDGGFSLY